MTVMRIGTNYQLELDGSVSEEVIGKGILLIGVTEIQPMDGRPAIEDGLYPTGYYMVAEKDLVGRILSEECMDEVQKRGYCLVTQMMLNQYQMRYKDVSEETGFYHLQKNGFQTKTVV